MEPLATRDQAAQAVNVLLEIATDQGEHAHARIDAAQAIIGAAYPLGDLDGEG